MARLLDDILLVGKADAGKLVFNPQPLNLEVFCHELISEYQLKDANRLNFSFNRATMNSPGAAEKYWMDPHLLQQMLANLLSNAFKYSAPESQVNFLVTVGETKIIFKIEDRGIGIPIEEQPRLFEPFHRAYNVGAISGTGLGLTIVKRAADLHGAVITYSSVPGKGTVFEVTLPLHPNAGPENLADTPKGPVL